MEEFSFGNFFRFLALQKIQLPVAETAIVQGDSIDCILYTDDQGFVKKRPLSKSLSVLSYLQKLQEESDFKNRMRYEKSSKVCNFYRKTQKTLILDTKLKELLFRPNWTINIDLIQKYIEPLSSIDKPLVLKLNYLDHQFITELMYGNTRINDPIILNLALDIAIVLIHAFEISQCKRVIQLEVEYIKESPCRIWLSNVQKCLLIEAKYTINFPLHKPEDHESLLKSLPKSVTQTKSAKGLKGPKIIKKLPPLSLNREKDLYVFRKGQLRNTHSNLESPIHITMNNNKGDKSQLHIEKKEEPLNTECTGNLNYVSDSPDLSARKSPEKGLIKELLTGFLTVPKSVSTSALIDFKQGPRSPIDPQKRNNSTKRSQGPSFKTLPKLSRARKLGYGNNFIELVMNTYCKNKESFTDRSADFGLASNITSEEFTNFLSKADIPKDLQGKLSEKVIVEESDGSKSLSPVELFPKRLFEFQFVNNILAKRKELISSLKKKKKNREPSGQKILSMILKSPKARKVNFKGN